MFGQSFHGWLVAAGSKARFQVEHWLLADIDEQMKFSESLIKVDTKLMQTGDLRIADLILAINNYLSIKNLKTQTNITHLQLINQLNYWNR